MVVSSCVSVSYRLGSYDGYPAKQREARALPQRVVKYPAYILNPIHTHRLGTTTNTLSLLSIITITVSSIYVYACVGYGGDLTLWLGVYWVRLMV